MISDPGNYEWRTPVTRVLYRHKHELKKFNLVAKNSKITQAHVYVWILQVDALASE